MRILEFPRKSPNATNSQEFWTPPNEQLLLIGQNALNSKEFRTVCSHNLSLISKNAISSWEFWTQCNENTGIPQEVCRSFLQMPQIPGHFCYTGVDQITTKGAGGSTHCQDNMLPRRECFLRIERALHRFCHKPSEGLARSVVLSHHSRV